MESFFFFFLADIIKISNWQSVSKRSLVHYSITQQNPAAHSERKLLLDINAHGFRRHCYDSDFFIFIVTLTLVKPQRTCWDMRSPWKSSPDCRRGLIHRRFSPSAWAKICSTARHYVCLLWQQASSVTGGGKKIHKRRWGKPPSLPLQRGAADGGTGPNSNPFWPSILSF